MLLTGLLAVLENEDCSTWYHNIEVLKAKLKIVWDRYPWKLYATISDFPKRIQYVVKPKGNNIE